MEGAEHKQKVADLLTDETKWTQLVFARGKSGLSVRLDGRYAVCWCLIGAIEKCYGERADDIKDRILSCRPEIGNISVWNDDPGRTFEEVRSLITQLDI